MTRVRTRPVNSTRRRSAKEPNAANMLTWGFEKHRCAMAKAVGITTAALTERLMTRRSGSLDLNHWRTPGRELLGAGTDGAAAWGIGLRLSSRGLDRLPKPRCPRARRTPTPPE